MLTVHQIAKSYGVQPVLENVSFSISGRERIGLIGPNGCGKTTLMRILAGIELPDSGSVIRTRPNISIGYLAQGGEFSAGATIQSAVGSDTSLHDAEVQRLASALSAAPGDADLQSKYDLALQRLSTVENRSAVLASLGLDQLTPDSATERLSGGQKTRLMLARVLIQEPDLLLLDEPTNHLDIGMLEWLENWVAGFRGAALIVSHDRAFLDNTVDQIFDLDPETHNIVAYAGNYSVYLEQFLSQRERQMASYRDQQYEIRRMKQDIARTKEQARHVEITTTPRQPGVRRIAKKVAAKAKARERKLDRYLGSAERVDRPKASWQLKLEFQSPAKSSHHILSMDKLAVGYPGNRPLLTDMSLTVRSGERIALTGPNGSGKTSLLRTIAGLLPPLEGHIRLGASVRLGYMAQEQELLDPGASALEAVQSVAAFNETASRNFLHYFLFEGDTSLRPARELSFGERARLQLALLVAQGSTFLLLDEPLNHLDIPSKARFEQALSSFKGTALAVVHDRYFIDHFASTAWMLSDGKVRT